MRALISPRSTDVRAWVTPEDLNVAPELLGKPLATPAKRAMAMLIDLLLISLTSNLGNIWWLCATGVGGLLWLRRKPEKPRRIGWAIVAVMLALGAQQTWQDLTREPGATRTHAAAESTSASEEADSKDQRIAELEAKLAKERAKQPPDLRSQIKHWIDEIGLSYGWALLYFSLLPVAWPGQTVGKRLLGLRVVELTGKPLTLMTCFKRYGGYAAGMATGFMGFIQIFWDSNCQTIEDKTAHTVVIDLRNPARLAVHQTPAVDIATAGNEKAARN